ncbi:MAG: ABC transporter permease [Sphaerobacteraceae bacterium]|nr:MAG: ABC transporter permease [Sphaerobacteraceae bacterium]
MRTFAADTWHLYLRYMRNTLRLPIWIAVTLVQPVIWLFLYGQLFRRIVELPGFGEVTYIQHLTPGVVIMTAMFGSAWSGMSMIRDLDEGIMDRLLSTTVHRGAIISARVMHASFTVLVQSMIILLMGLALGARIDGGVTGVVAIIILALLLGASFSAISNGIALLARREETLIAVVNFFGLPLVFLSTAFIAADLMPGWIRSVSEFNPVNWAILGSRSAMLGEDWMLVLQYSGLLLAFVLVCSYFATLAFRVYQRAS